MAFKIKLLTKSLYLEIEDLGHLAKILKSAPGFLYLQIYAFDSEFVFGNGKSGTPGQNREICSLAFKIKLLTESLRLEMEDLGHLAKIVKSAPGLLFLQN